MRTSRLVSVLFAACCSVLVHCGGDDGAAPAGGKGLPTRSDGCGKDAAASPKDGTTATVNGRTYRYFVPAGYAKDTALPVVYVLHGSGANGLEMSRYIQMQEYVAGQAIVVFPDAQRGQWDVSGQTDLEFFDAMSEQVNSALCTNPSRVYVEGFSLGAYMTNYLGCQRGAKLRGIAAADGGFPGKSDACTATAALVYHKSQDDNEAIANGEKARDAWKTINGCGAGTEKYGALACVAYQNCGAGTPLVWCKDDKQTAYAHDLDEAYRVPIWQWFQSLE